jgi:hypothetical protein
MIKNRLDNYLIPPKNGHLTYIVPKFYINCPPRGLVHAMYVSFKQLLVCPILGSKMFEDGFFLSNPRFQNVC